MANQKILIIGGGGREHAIGWKIQQGKRETQLYFAPGNAGTAQIGINLPIKATDISALLNFAKAELVDLTLALPDDPLALGVVDTFQAENLRIWGPTKAASELEWSKAYAKDFMKRHNIPTAKYEVFTDYEKAKNYIEKGNLPIVIKASGLALGKGVTVAHTAEDALNFLNKVLVDKIFGNAGNEVVIEEYLSGVEISIHAISDGKNWKIFPASQDHKRIYDNNAGPNTGGMGTIAPIPFVDEASLARIEKEIIAPVIMGMAQEGRPFIGCLYPGIMLTKEGPKVFEFNSRFGDPETQTYMRLLNTDILDIFDASIDGKIGDLKINWKNISACNIAIASKGYPGDYEKGKIISGIREATTEENIVVFHAGTKLDENGNLLTNGGRVLGVSATGQNLKEALQNAYSAILKIKFEGMQYRGDIGKEALAMLEYFFMKKGIQSALISAFNKDGLEEILKLLQKQGVHIISTGGTAKFIRELKIPVTEVEDLTKFPAMFGGRVKTLQPQIFGGILNRRDNVEDQQEKEKHNIKDIDLVIVDLYPFEETLAKGGSDAEIIEKIDIGGVSLIRAAAKNFNDVVVIPSKNQYKEFTKILKKGVVTTLEERKKFAGNAFEVTSAYDTAIRGYFQNNPLRYGENPHQAGAFIGNLAESFTQLHGKELSYNNLIDTEAAINLVYDFKKPAFAIIKHMNACGLAVREEGKLLEAYKAAYKADPLSAFGGILATNRKIDEDIAKLIKKQELFVEVIIAPDFSQKALEIFKEKKNCRLLKWHEPKLPKTQMRTCFTGILTQDRDTQVEKEKDLTIVTSCKPSKKEVEDMLMASIATKHLKSNSVALVKNNTLLAMGCGQTSRIDALKQAIDKAKKFKFSLKGSALSSEAFFPFPDCVELAGKVGVSSVIQPGGSKNDDASIKMAEKYKMAMIVTGFRHFKH